ncbi:MAG: N-acyl homoserine lactonase family protein [Pseudomonadales bacterium]|nr:N-acyl homoserine lactonase family protein [Pseudomonadales bacterium]
MDIRHLLISTLTLFLTLNNCMVFADNKKSPATVEALVIFKCGTVNSPDRSLWSPGVDVNVKHQMVASCYLIRHKDGMMVWDTGIPEFVKSKPEDVTLAQGKIKLTLEQPFPEALKSFGVKPEEIDFLALSHMHADHAGNANAFATATWLVQEAEYDAAFGPLAKQLNFNPKTYEKLSHSKVIKLNGHHDVFSDGSVILIPAPGHTPGHQVLFVRLPSGPVVLSGDLWHFQSNWKFSRVPGFNYDPKQTADSMKAINALLIATGAKLYIQHDFVQNSQLPHAPDIIR